MSPRNRILLGLLATVIGSFAYLLFWISDDLEPRYRGSVEESLVDFSRILAAVVEQDLDQAGKAPERLTKTFELLRSRGFEAKIYEVLKSRVDTRVYLTDEQGTVLFDSTGALTGQNRLEWWDVRNTLQGGYGARTTRDVPDDPTSTVLYVGAPLHHAGKIAGALVIGEPTAGLNQFIVIARSRIITGTILTFVAVLVIGLLVAFLITRPIGLVVDYFNLLRQSRTTSLPRLGMSALGIIGRTYHEMREALEGRAYVERYVQALTHEVKSPLSAIRGAAELLDEPTMTEDDRRRFLKNIRSEAARIQIIVDRLLELAALEKRSGLESIETVDLRTVLEEVISPFAGPAGRRRIELLLDVPDLATVKGDPFLIRQAITNLVQNAVDFAAEGTAVEICVRPRGRSQLIEVLDRGPGIPEFAAGRIFDRFYSLERPGSGRKSTGLGLSFVKEIAELHRGAVTVSNREGGGVRAALTLPTT